MARVRDISIDEVPEDAKPFISDLPMNMGRF